MMGNHHKVILELLRCGRVETPEVTTTEAPTIADHKPPLIKNVLGENLYASLQGFFSADHSSDTQTEEQSIARTVITREEITCESLRRYDIVLTENVSLFLGAFVIAIVAFLLLVCAILIRNRRGKKCLALVEVDTKVEDNSSSPRSSTDVFEKSLPHSQVSEESFNEQKHISEELYNKIPLSYQLRAQPGYSDRSAFDLATFLCNISETLFSKLDQLLLKDPLVDQTRSHATIATPRLARRSLGNRQRLGSTPTLQALASTGADSGTSFIERKQAWDTLKIFSKEMNWKQPDYLQFEESKFDRKIQRLIHFYQRVCPIKSDHWKATAFLTNFTLFLLQAEKDNLICQNGYQFVKFIPTGSGKTGTMVGRPNEFDVLMILQSPVIPKYAVTEDNKESLPPGHILIVAELPDGTSVAARETTCYVRLEKEKLSCLSSREFSRAAVTLIEMSIQSLYTKTRSLMDRLPFVIRKSPTANLSVSIDTRSLVGLGLPEIKINIIPVLPLMLNGWYQSGMTYAMPLPQEDRYKAQSPSTNSISEDCMWQINCDEINDMFLQGVDLKMKHAGVESCHQLCLMILKTLFTGKDKNSLLDKGTVQSYILVNAMHFLLLESTPEQWAVQNLSDRFSDLIHFLRAVFRNGRLPSFFINNPHLMSKMPAVAANPTLARKRQRNILTDLTQERLDKCLDYMERCVGDARLQDLVKGEYSDSMWEYEFFIFN